MLFLSAIVELLLSFLPLPSSDVKVHLYCQMNFESPRKHTFEVTLKAYSEWFNKRKI